MTRVSLLVLDDASGQLIGLPGVSRVRILDEREGEVDLRVPGHKEPVGYDRLRGGTIRGYVRAATRTLTITETYEDRGRRIVAGSLREETTS